MSLLNAQKNLAGMLKPYFKKKSIKAKSNPETCNFLGFAYAR